MFLYNSLILSLLIRSFLFEPFSIPTSSMMPTLLPGDHIVVAKSLYGLRLPFTRQWVYFKNPKRSDVIVFYHPEKTHIPFVKRVAALPGDRIQFKGGELVINGVPILHEPVNVSGAVEHDRCQADVTVLQDGDGLLDLLPFPYFRGQKNYFFFVEKFVGTAPHLIQRAHKPRKTADSDIIIPDGHFFVVGDNRDHSDDSRVFGMITKEHIIGKVTHVWFSLEKTSLKCTNPFSDEKNSSVVRWYRLWRRVR